MACFMCKTCGVQHAESAEPPSACAICEDERQYVPETGQQWTTLDELRSGHRNEIRDDHGLTGIGTTPGFAIEQRALLVQGVLWDCISLIDDATVERVRELGGIRAIAISHPHYYSSLVEWARAFDAPVYLHAADREWIMRPDPCIELWDGETKELDDGLTLIRAGGHYPGGTVLHWAGGNAVLSGDIIQVIPDRRFVSFMWSYPNLIPLPAAEVRRVAAAVEPFAFDRIYGAWWGRFIPKDGKDVVRRSAERYARALEN